MKKPNQIVAGTNLITLIHSGAEPDDQTRNALFVGTASQRLWTILLTDTERRALAELLLSPDRREPTP